MPGLGVGFYPAAGVGCYVVSVYVCICVWVLILYVHMTIAVNKVGDEGAKDLARALENNSTLQSLELGGACCHTCMCWFGQRSGLGG